jgi:hypothetical protein
MWRLAHFDGHNAPWLADEIVPSEAAVVDDFLVGLEDSARPIVITDELPQNLDGVRLGQNPASA